MNKRGQIGISVTGLVMFFITFIVLISLMPIIMDFVAIGQNITNLTVGTKVVIGLVPLMLGVATLVAAIGTRAIAE